MTKSARVTKAKLKKKREVEQILQRNMKLLGISREEAEELYRFDTEEAGFADPKEKPKKETLPNRSSLDKVKNLKAKAKADKEKEAIIDAVFEFLQGNDLYVDPQVMSGTKMSFKGQDGGFYSVSVTKHKSKPDGYKDID